MNDQGLCVADTHVPSTDVGPGVPRFSSMMHLLEGCGSTDEAVDYLLAVPQMGLGNLTLLDAYGSAAVVECGYHRTVVVSQADRDRHGGGVVATNHHTDSLLSGCLLEPEDGTPGANSRARASVVAGFMASIDGCVPGPEDLRSLAASHVGFDGENTREGSLCQHGPDLKAETVSTVVFDPHRLTMDLCLGRPCTEPFTTIGL